MSPQVFGSAATELADELVTDEAAQELDMTTAGLAEDVNLTDASADEQPIAETAETIDRGAKEDLSQHPQFRKLQSENDRKVAALNKRLAELEASQAQAAAARAEAELNRLEQAIDNETDPTQRRMLLRNFVTLQSKQEVQAWSAWQRHVIQRVHDEGLDPSAFDAMSYSGDAGAMQFERDLLAAKAKKLEAEVKALRGQTAPDAKAKVAKQELRSLAAEKGFSTPDLGSGKSASTHAASIEAFNAGRISRTEFLKQMGRG